MAKITINDNCIGCGACTGVAADVFALNDDGLAEVIDDANIDGAKEAAECCPVEAIEVEE
ncbi:ferredoxin [Thomasclavelia sp.]|uniref:ferredoxin n=1 Tax=Thomasclavelia sp. TaxID=3025757 RepID=UPI0025D50A1A|nr:ferredoxin [Thomasclavelia sp.]